MTVRSLWAVILGASLGTAGAAEARPCGPYCQSCVDELRIPRSPDGEPQFRQSPVSKATFRGCIARVQPNGGINRSGNHKRAGAR